MYDSIPFLYLIKGGMLCTLQYMNDVCTMKNCVMSTGTR